MQELSSVDERYSLSYHLAMQVASQSRGFPVFLQENQLILPSRPLLLCAQPLRQDVRSEESWVRLHRNHGATHLVDRRLQRAEGHFEDRGKPLVDRAIRPAADGPGVSGRLG